MSTKERSESEEFQPATREWAEGLPYPHEEFGANANLCWEAGGMRLTVLHGNRWLLNRDPLNRPIRQQVRNLLAAMFPEGERGQS